MRKELPNKVTAHDVNERIRLKDNKNDEEDFWFQYEHARRELEFEEVASRVRRMLQVEDIGWIRDLLEKETKNCTSFERVKSERVRVVSDLSFILFSLFFSSQSFTLFSKLTFDELDEASIDSQKDQ